MASNSTFTAQIGSDTGTWVQAGQTAGLFITGGADQPGDCVFAGHVNKTGTGISSASKPGNWACPGDTKGTFYIAPVPPGASAAPAHAGSFASMSARPATAGKMVLGTYTWTEDGYYSGQITLEKHNVYASTLSGNDSGGWIQAGSAAAVTIFAGVDSGIGCLEVGKVNHTGTAIGTTAKPGNWACPGTGTSGYFVIN